MRGDNGVTTEELESASNNKVINNGMIDKTCLFIYVNHYFRLQVVLISVYWPFVVDSMDEA